jgi:hypothetical protein
VTLNTAVATKLFAAQDTLKASMGKPISAPATVGWLLDNCEQKLQAMMTASGSGGQPREQDVGGQGPGRHAHDHGLDMGLLSDIGPSRVLPALRKRDAFYDEELGFLDLDDPEMNPEFQEVEGEVGGKTKEAEQKAPKVFLGELDKLAEFVALFPPVCHARDCGCRMELERVVSLNSTAVMHLKCSAGHLGIWRSAEEDVASQVPAITKRYFHAALCAGMGFTELEEFSEELGLHHPRKVCSTIFRMGMLQMQVVKGRSKGGVKLFWRLQIRTWLKSGLQLKRGTEKKDLLSLWMLGLTPAEMGIMGLFRLLTRKRESVLLWSH